MPRAAAGASTGLWSCDRWSCASPAPPRGRLLQAFGDAGDIADAFGFEPPIERGDAVAGVDGDALLPDGAAAEDAGVARAGFGGEFQGCDELVDADAGAEVDVGAAGDGVDGAKAVERFGAGVGAADAGS